MNSFDEFFKKKFSDLHEACCCGDLVAMNYKKAMKKTWNEQQKKIDRALEFTENVHDENWQDAIACIKELLK